MKIIYKKMNINTKLKYLNVTYWKQKNLSDCHHKYNKIISVSMCVRVMNGRKNFVIWSS